VGKLLPKSTVEWIEISTENYPLAAIFVGLRRWKLCISVESNFESYLSADFSGRNKN
jgi:hypothetical protein